MTNTANVFCPQNIFDKYKIIVYTKDTHKLHINNKNMVTKLIGIREFRNNITSLHEKARKNNWRFIVLNRNQPVFRVEPLGPKDAVLEKLALDIAEARKDVKKGRLYSADEIRKEFGL